MRLSKYYKIKCINDDFQVTEVPLIPLLTSEKPYKFTYIWVQKSGFITFDVIEQLKIFFKLKFEDVNSQGLKDEDAVTEQLISVKKVLTNKDVANFNEKHKGKNKFSRIKFIFGYGNEPVKERMLHGNVFKIVLRDLENDLADELVNYIVNRRYHYFINYYDCQRFGMPGGPYNTYLIGKAIIENNWKKAYNYIKITNNNFPKISKKSKNSNDFKELFISLNPQKISFFVASYNSFLWNNAASLMLKKYTECKKHEFENVGNLYFPVRESFQCPSFYNINGYEFSAEIFSAKKKIYNRNFIVATAIYIDKVENDELHKGKRKVILSFFLPTGSYATMIIRQLFLRLKNK